MKGLGAAEHPGNLPFQVNGDRHEGHLLRTCAEGSGPAKKFWLLADVAHSDRFTALDNPSDDTFAARVLALGHLLLRHPVGKGDLEIIRIRLHQDQEALGQFASAGQDLADLGKQVFKNKGGAEGLADLEQGLILDVSPPQLGKRLGVLKNLRGLGTKNRQQLEILFGKVILPSRIDTDHPHHSLVQNHGDRQLRANVLLDHDIAIFFAHVGNTESLAMLGHPPRDSFADTKGDLVPDIVAETARGHDPERLPLQQDHRAGRGARIANARIEKNLEESDRVEGRVQRQRDLLEDFESTVDKRSILSSLLPWRRRIRRSVVFT